MSADPRPWWASDADELATGEDPLLVHRAARRGDEPGAAEPGDPAAEPGDPAEELGDPAEELGDPAATGGSGAAGAPAEELHRPDICGVCPVCVTARYLEETQPELLAHLSEAARHLVAAVRTLVDLDEDSGQGARRPASAADDVPGPADGDVHRIDLD